MQRSAEPGSRPLPPSVRPWGGAWRLGGTVVAALLAISAVALSLSFALVSHIRATECPSYHYGDPSYFGMAVSRHALNWTVTVTSTQRGYEPNGTHVEIRDPRGVLDLGRTPWSALTTANWSTYHVLYEDSQPVVPSVCEGDRLIVDAVTYETGSVLRVLSHGSFIGSATLY